MTTEHYEEEEKEIVKYKGRWWVLDKISRNMAVLWRDGVPALARLEEVEFLEDRPFKG